MRIKILSVKALDKYRLFIQFNEGSEGVLNLEGLAGKGVFKSWDKDDNFSKAFVSNESGAITWPEEIDIDTLNAYFTIKNINPEEYFKREKGHAAHL
jgi:uncharacterized protein DUF2442